MIDFRDRGARAQRRQVTCLGTCSEQVSWASWASAHSSQVLCFLPTPLADHITLGKDPGKNIGLSLGHIPLMPRVTRQWQGGENPLDANLCSLTPPLSGRKMRVYQREEALGGPEAHAVFREPSQAAEQALSAEELQPVGLPGPARGGLEGPERRRFSASELMARLHSSLRLGRNSAARALIPGSGSGPRAALEGTSSPRGPKSGARGRSGAGSLDP